MVGGFAAAEVDAPAGHTLLSVTFRIPGALAYTGATPGTNYTVPDANGNTVGYNNRLTTQSYDYHATPPPSTKMLSFYWDETTGQRDVQADVVLDDGSTYTGHLYVTVEAPTANSFVIKNNAALEFTQVDNNGRKAQQGQGAGFGFIQPLQTAQVYTAKATNTTTIAGVFGIIQLADATWSYQHVGKPAQTATTSGYESDPSNPGKYGFYYYRALAATPSNAVQDLPDPNDKIYTGTQFVPNVIVDAPSFNRPFSSGGGFLQSISMISKFKSMLTYQANGGIPIALATAEWTVQGSATNGAVALAGGNTLANETNMANWAVGTLISSPMPSDGSPPTTNDPRWSITITTTTLKLVPTWTQTARKALATNNPNFFNV